MIQRQRFFAFFLVFMGMVFFGAVSTQSMAQSLKSSFHSTVSDSCKGNDCEIFHFDKMVFGILSRDADLVSYSSPKIEKSANTSNDNKNDRVALLKNGKNINVSTKKDEMPMMNEKTLFAFGVKALQEGDLKRSLNYFERIEDQFAYSPLYQVSQVMSAYLYFLLESFEASNTIINDVLSLYADTAYSDFLYYLRANNYYYAFVNKDLGIQALDYAISSVDTLCNKFPNHEFCAEGKSRVLSMRNMLAYQDLQQAKYYAFTESGSLASLISYQSLLEKYRDWPELDIMPELLFRLASWYAYFGWYEESSQTLNRLRRDYPNNYWSSHSSLWLNLEVLLYEKRELNNLQQKLTADIKKLTDYCEYLKNPEPVPAPAPSSAPKTEKATRKQTKPNTKVNDKPNTKVNDKPNTKVNKITERQASNRPSIPRTVPDNNMPNRLKGITLENCDAERKKKTDELMSIDKELLEFDVKAEKWLLDHGDKLDDQMPGRLKYASCAETFADFSTTPKFCIGIKKTEDESARETKTDDRKSAQPVKNETKPAKSVR